MSNIDVYSNVVYNNLYEGIAVTDEEEGGNVHDIRVYNNSIYGNGLQQVNSGACLFVGSNVSKTTFSHNTCVGNIQGILVDGTWLIDKNGGSTPQDIHFINNIFATNGWRHGGVKDVDGLMLRNNLFTAEYEEFISDEGGMTNMTEEGNVSATDVGFVDVFTNDYQLTPESPAVDAGATTEVTTDFAENPRPSGEAPDIGAYENQ
ncbi:MAG: choice-of-anchor Q domain-containing protein [Chloroflexota bacterium]